MNLPKWLKIKKTRRRLSRSRRKIVYYRDGGRCRYCGKHIQYKDYHADHIIPVVRRNGEFGGNDYVFNLVASCRSCNLKKSNKEHIHPREISTWRKIYQFMLILWYMDLPSIEDFI